MKLVVSIINYRTKDLTIAAASSVLDVLDGREAQVVIVDNASSDGSAEAVEEWIADRGDKRLTLLRSPKNTGFSGGHNQVLAMVPDADFYLVVNSDTLFRSGFFDIILGSAIANPSAGLFAPQLESENGTPQMSCFRFARPTSELIRGAETGLVSRIFAKRMVALQLPPDPNEIEWASFACILIRGAMVRDLGLMDEGYFLYFEDVEYCLRARRAGWRIVHVPSARVVHFRGGSGPVKAMIAARKRLPTYFWRSRTRFFRQAYGRLGPLRANFAWMTGRLIAQTRRLAGHDVPMARDQEWRDIWTGFLDPLK